MHIILLSGGSGKRLWPLSNKVRSKQFIRILKNEETSEFESMVQRIHRQILTVDPSADITIATSKQQVSSIKNQLGEEVSICVEPNRRDTFPAIALASLYLHDEKKIDLNESVIVCPVDPYVDISYFESLLKLSELVKTNEYNLSLLGIDPTYPSEKYGYIIPNDRNQISSVKCFKEKPDEETAKEYIALGALWNGGVFAFKLGYMVDRIENILGVGKYQALLEQYETLDKISFDYAVAEKEPLIQVLRYNKQWKDIGTWNTFTEVMDGNSFGKAVLDDSCVNTHVINTLNIPVLCMGTKNLVVAAGNDGIIVSDKAYSSYIKKHVDQFDQQIMFAEKSWGSFTVLDVQENSMTIKIVLKSGSRLKYHSHQHRNEVWTVISGNGVSVLDGKKRLVSPGDVISLPQGSRHTIIASSELHVIEVQTGDIDVKDKIIFTELKN